jgi:molybdopterin-guanine dinucleotide biosynthesis protein A
VSVTAIVLAGGASTRFGGDKLAAELWGETVLARTIATVAPLADGVIVAGPRLPEGFVAGDIPVALIADHEPLAGPLAALANVLPTGAFGSAALGIVVGGDMPRLVPAVLVAMLDVLDQNPPVDAVLLGQEGPRRQVLPLAVRLDPAGRAARDAVEAGERSLQAFVDRLAAFELPARRWQALDPAGQTLTDVDTREDLDRLNAN